MEYRGGMLPDQWPRSVQADIEAVKVAVQNVDVDTQSVKEAVETTSRNLQVFMQLLFSGSNTIQTQTRTSILAQMTTDLTAIRKAVEDRASGVVWLPFYLGRPGPTPGNPSAWVPLSSVNCVVIDREHSCFAYLNYSTGGNQYRDGFFPWTVDELRMELQQFGVHVLAVPTGRAAEPADDAPWWRRWLRPRWRSASVLGLREAK